MEVANAAAFCCFSPMLCFSFVFFAFGFGFDDDFRLSFFPSEQDAGKVQTAGLHSLKCDWRLRGALLRSMNHFSLQSALRNSLGGMLHVDCVPSGVPTTGFNHPKCVDSAGASPAFSFHVCERVARQEGI